MWPAAPTRGARVLLWVLGFPVLRASTCTCSSQRFHHLLLLVLQEASGIRDLLRDQGSILGTSKSSKPWIQLWIQQPRIQLWISQTPYPQQTLASTRGDASRDASPHLLHSLRPSPPPPHTHTHAPSLDGVPTSLPGASCVIRRSRREQPDIRWLRRASTTAVGAVQSPASLSPAIRLSSIYPSISPFLPI